jgi:hypothetical protein
MAYTAELMAWRRQSLADEWSCAIGNASSGRRMIRCPRPLQCSCRHLVGADLRSRWQSPSWPVAEATAPGSRPVRRIDLSTFRLFDGMAGRRWGAVRRSVRGGLTRANWPRRWFVASMRLVRPELCPVCPAIMNTGGPVPSCDRCPAGVSEPGDGRNIVRAGFRPVAAGGAKPTKQPVAISPSGRVKLFGFGRDVEVDGNQFSVTDRQHALLARVIERQQTTGGCPMSELGKGGRDSFNYLRGQHPWDGVLKKLEQRVADTECYERLVRTFAHHLHTMIFS